MFAVGFQVEGPAASGFERCRARPFVAETSPPFLATVPRHLPSGRGRAFAAALESDQAAGSARGLPPSVPPKRRRHGSAFSVS